MDRTKRHEFIDILVRGICAIICGGDDYASMRAFGKAKEAWQRTILELPNGIPSHDTFWRVFSALGEIIALNGEQLRRSHDKSKGKAAIHMVSAWRRRIVLCSVRSTWTRSQTRSGPSLVQRRVTVDTSASITAPILTVQPRRSYQPCPCPARPSLTSPPLTRAEVARAAGAAERLEAEARRAKRRGTEA
ncbi:MAG: transposase family protein [Caldilineaceae bacterium]|nr:transposase family protein [Caldilineaceae bacterium]